MYAIIETGGKQYRVTTGDVLNIEKITGKAGDKVKFDKVLLVGGKDNKTLVGKPYVASAALEAEIVDDTFRGDKIVTIKYKRRKQYRRTMGHRQDLFRILVTKIEDGQGGKAEFDSSKRKEVLMKASVKTAAPKAAKTTAAKTEKTKKAAAPKAAAKKTK